MTIATATTAIQCGIVLHPAGHTKSPAMHRAAYRHLGIDAQYDAHDVPPEDLANAVKRFRDQGLRQFAVSIPHKEAMLALVDEVEPVAREIGAINTVTLVDGRLIGTNTDWLGALRALERVGAGSPGDGTAVVLGAGGTARALVYGLRQRGYDVTVLNRTLARAKTLVRELGATHAGELDELTGLKPRIIVNTTSVGLNEMVSPIVADAISDSATVLDVVYSPERTQLMQDAEARGAKAIGGKWMLVYQAVEQLRIWTKSLKNPPSDRDLESVVEVMAKAFGQE
jgi:shikimate dehydrogenase